MRELGFGSFVGGASLKGEVEVDVTDGVLSSTCMASDMIDDGGEAGDGGRSQLGRRRQRTREGRDGYESF